VFIVFFLANLLMIPFGWAAIKAAKRILDIPRNILMPIILLFCVVGAFAINNSLFAVTVVLVFGLAGYFMEENGYPVAPAILGMILGTMLEEHFISSMIKSDGRLMGFFERPIAAGLGVLTLIVWLWPLLAAWRRRATASTRE
jgi:putative tricarboxylic transport membrane protein